MKRKLVLCSASPRRAELLQSAGYEITIRPPVGVEEIIDPSLTPADNAISLARLKATAASSGMEPDGAVFVAADTIVVLGREIFGKPRDDGDARGMLASLSGKTHEVITGVCVISGGLVRCAADTTAVTFRKLGRGDIDAYIRTGEHRDKAGSYAIQGEAGKFVVACKGSMTNVIGLPMELLGKLLAD